MRLKNNRLADSWEILLFSSSVNSQAGLTTKAERLQNLQLKEKCK